jgi:hypothetical protein
MDYHELLTEIRENRKQIIKAREEFYFFKGKAYGFIALLSIVFNAAIAYITKK